MLSRTALTKANSAARIHSGGRARSKPSVSSPAVKPGGISLATDRGGVSTAELRPFTSAVDAKKQKRDKDRDFLISVLESSATKRDAKAYLQTFGPATNKPATRADAPNLVLPTSIRSVEDRPRFVQGVLKEAAKTAQEVPHVTLVTVRYPQAWDDRLLSGVAKTLTQLRGLGFLSVIVVDCGLEAAGNRWELRKLAAAQADRVAVAIRQFGAPGAKVVDTAMWRSSTASVTPSPVASHDIVVGFGEAITTPLRTGHLVVVPTLAYTQESSEMTLTDSNGVVFALTRFLSGLQFSESTNNPDAPSSVAPSREALVDRVIVIDPLGGIPAKDALHGAQVFLNLEDQFEAVQQRLQSRSQSDTKADDMDHIQKGHMRNLQLGRDTLGILPATSSAVITSPIEAANLRQDDDGDSSPLLSGPVGTRRTQNPLIHNLLTDRPVYSSSLPIGRIKPTANTQHQMPTTTLVKRGLPVTIFPDTAMHSWAPPKPGTPRLRLTDTCVDLSRLVHLIDDSFNRKLDAEHYLRRVEDSLAGVIIAGEYEGGAILTWECPFGLDQDEAYRTGRLVPYLDKFAVLKKSQGAGGVADIVFNAMVRDCFPYGVCWRSRKDNPVNKWYFERSRGTRKLSDSNWTMFWTTPGAALDEQKMKDYEDVCRNIVPSWKDTKKPAD